MKKLLVILLFLAGCAPGRMVGTGYLVTVQHGIKTNWDKVETPQEADAFVWKHAGLNFDTDSIIGDHYPFWTFRNGTVEVYVEKKGVYEKRPYGKKRWKMYDEELKIEN